MTSNHIEEEKQEDPKHPPGTKSQLGQKPVARQTTKTEKKEPSPKKYEPSEIELQFLLMGYQEGFRYYQGVLIHGDTPIVFIVEQVCAFAKKEERALRI